VERSLPDLSRARTSLNLVTVIRTSTGFSVLAGVSAILVFIFFLGF
jgi:hypothetical protein